MKSLVEQQNSFINRWGAPELNVDNDKEFNKFRLRIINFFNSSNLYRGEDNFLNLNLEKLGLYYPEENLDLSYRETQIEVIIDSLNIENNFLEFLFKLKLLVNEILFYERFDSNKLFHNSFIFDRFKDIFNISTINVRIIIDKNFNIDFYPMGDKLLDKKLIEDVLTSLHEASRIEYLKALKFYQEKDYNNSANQLRKTLESWLKHILEVKMTLENTFKNLDSAIKKQLNKKIETIYGKDKNKTNMQVNYISDFIEQAFSRLKSLFVKYETPHNDGGLKHAQEFEINLLECELEFMLYQTGSIIRFIDRVLELV